MANKKSLAMYNGALQELAIGDVSNQFSIARLTATQASTVITLASITQLVLPLAINSIYKIECFVVFQSAAITTGLNLAILTPAGATNFIEIKVPIVSTAGNTTLSNIFPSAAIAVNTGGVLGTGVTAITSNHTAIITGFISVGATAGNCQIQFATEVGASGVTLQIGSLLVLQRIT